MSPSAPAPSPGFRVIERGRVRALVRPEATSWVDQVLESGRTLHEAAARVPGALSLQGRGAVHAIPTPLPDGPGAEEDRWVVRHYHRGGAVAALLGDRYLGIGVPRPFRELRASEEVRTRGILTPRVIAAAIYRSSGVYRGDIVTEYIPDTLELADLLFGSGGVRGGGGRIEGLSRAGALVRELGDKGVFHPDLNAKNVLLKEDSGSWPTAYLIDLDRCGTAHRADAQGQGARDLAPGGKAESMYRRLRRSLRKWEEKSGRILAAEEWSALESGFRGDAPAGLDLERATE